MSSRKIIYGAALLIGLGFIVTFRYARYNDVDLPVWVPVAAAPVVIGLIALDVRSRRTKSGSNARDGQPENTGGPA